MTFHVRVSDPDDYDAVSALLERSYSALMAPAYGDAFARVGGVIWTANRVLLRSGNFFVAVPEKGNSDILIGCGGWSLERPGSGDVEPGLGHIRHFGVDPKWLRKGVGRAIINECEAQAREEQVREFECYSSRNAETFYRALGFKKTGIKQLEMVDGAGLESIVMRRKI